MEARSSNIPNFIKATSPMGLRRLMLLNSAKLGMQIKYYDIQYVVEEKSSYWIAWFNSELQNNDPLIQNIPPKAGE